MKRVQDMKHKFKRMSKILAQEGETCFQLLRVNGDWLIEDILQAPSTMSGDLRA